MTLDQVARWPVTFMVVLFVSVAAISMMVIAGARTSSKPAHIGNCIENGRAAFNTGPCIYNPRTDTCPDYNLMNYANACFIVVPEQP